MPKKLRVLITGRKMPLCAVMMRNWTATSIFLTQGPISVIFPSAKVKAHSLLGLLSTYSRLYLTLLQITRDLKVSTPASLLKGMYLTSNRPITFSSKCPHFSNKDITVNRYFHPTQGTLIITSKRRLKIKRRQKKLKFR